MKVGVIYKVQNLDNGRIYVGCTLKFGHRVQQHINAALRGSLERLFYPELKVSPESFSFQMLETNVPFSELKQKESQWIAKLGSKDTGYNKCVYHGHESISTETVKEIGMWLEESSATFKEIAALFDVSPDMVSSINRGESWINPDKTYPLRRSTIKRKKLTIAQLELIHQRLADKTYSFADIATEFGWKSQAVLRKINAGTYSIRLLPSNAYPIRPVDSRKGSRQR